MAEALDEPGAEAGGPSPIDAEAGLAAAALAVASRRRRRKVDDGLDAFLDKQGRLIDVQMEHLHEQRELILSRLRWGRFSDRMKALLQCMTAVVGLAVVVVIGVMAWQAHADHGVAIEAFSTPPDLAARGLTGQVIASELLDRLADLQAQTVTARPASTYANDWGGDIKVEIPETGVSIGELNRYLRQWLGSETRITGEVVRTPAGLAVTARAGSAPGRTFAGPEASLDALVGQAAEAIYAETQPYRYAVYLSTHGKPDEALATFARLARSGSAADRPWAYAGWSAALLQSDDPAGAESIVKEGMRQGLDLYESGGVNNLGVAETELDHDQAELDAVDLALREGKRTGRGYAGLTGPAALLNTQAVIALLKGDARTAASIWRSRSDIDLEGIARGLQTQPLVAAELIEDHEIAAGLRLSAPTTIDLYGPATNAMRAAFQLKNWPRLVALGEQQLLRAGAGRYPPERFDWPMLALGYAGTGRTADAKALVGRTPLDCDRCLDARAQIAAMASDAAGADRWFAAVERHAPDIPFYDADWAAARLARGDVGGAIAKAREAHEKGPHFADPLETWGEALMRKGNFKGASSKFAEADQDAPRWGRNHLMWGEALARLGRRDEATAQWRAAAGMDLSAPDRAELNALLARPTAGPRNG